MSGNYFKVTHNVLIVLLSFSMSQLWLTVQDASKMQVVRREKRERV
jgi:hypothetical protein